MNFVEGLPDGNSQDPSRNNFIIIDDLMHEADKKIAKLFTQGSHHKNASVIFLTQNIFHQKSIPEPSI